MSGHALAAALVAASYLLGSVPFGFLLARTRGIDIRATGSGNIGATNVSRSLGKRLGALVLALDALKGALPIVAVRGLGLDQSVDPFVLTACGVAAISGHCFPVWLRFRGGKGVATTFGVFLAVDPLSMGLCMALFAALYAIFRVASVGSLAAALTLPALMWALDRPDEAVILAIISSAIIVIKHRANIGRLLRGEEHSA
jgi:acyl phosphate:glycerol-3-phosphate acyltransferase